MSEDLREGHNEVCDEEYKCFEGATDKYKQKKFTTQQQNSQIISFQALSKQSPELCSLQLWIKFFQTPESIDYK